MGTTNDVWVFVEHSDGAPKKVALELATKARALAAALGGQTAAVAFGAGAAATAAKLGAYGAAKLYAAEDAAFDNYFVTPHSKVLADLVREKQPKLVLFGSTPNGKDIAARLAAKLELGLIVNATDVNMENGQLVALKPAFGGSINVNSAFVEGRTTVLLMRPNAIAPEQSGEGAASVEQVAAGLSDSVGTH
ncbi:MAG: hypothetical protein EPO21_21840 [Chloroflexota bacterium]|nr:MAG: hypothetical protein EPO21_21840 [Chloroflexota bacterium]